MVSNWRKRLADGNGYRLTLVLTPTETVWAERLRRWRAALDQPVAWVALTAADNAPEHFLATLIESLQRICPAVEAVERTLSPQDGLVDLLNMLLSLPEEAVLVLAGYDLIETQAVHEAVARMLDYLPPQLRLVIISRNVPPLPNLPRLRARRQLWQVGRPAGGGGVANGTLHAEN